MKTSTETVSAFTAKTHLSGLLKEVQKGNLYIVVLRGKPIAMIIPYTDELKVDSIEDSESKHYPKKKVLQFSNP